MFSGRVDRTSSSLSDSSYIFFTVLMYQVPVLNQAADRSWTRLSKTAASRFLMFCESAFASVGYSNIHRIQVLEFFLHFLFSDSIESGAFFALQMYFKSCWNLKIVIVELFVYFRQFVKISSFFLYIERTWQWMGSYFRSSCCPQYPLFCKILALRKFQSITKYRTQIEISFHSLSSSSSNHQLTNFISHLWSNYIRK